MLKNDIALNTLFTHVVGSEVINREGQAGITRLLYNIDLWRIEGTRRYHETENAAAAVKLGRGNAGAIVGDTQNPLLDLWGSLPYLPDGTEEGLDGYVWDWSWTVQKGKYRGNLPKRIQQYYRQFWGINLNDEIIKSIGNIASSARSVPATYYFEFVDDFAWQAGDFGDSGSCFWASRTRDRFALLYNKVWAVRFYRDATKQKGIARAWVAVDRPLENSLIIFNGYGFEGDPTAEIAKVLASYFEVDTRSVHIKNNGTETESIFLNGGGKGRIVAHADSITTLENTLPKSSRHAGDPIYDFKMKIDILGRCPHTGEWLHQDDWNYRHGGNFYSKAGFDALFAHCAVSNDVLLRTEMHVLPDGRMVTPRVWREMTVPCHWCGQPHLKDTLSWVDGSFMMVCDECMEAHVSTCAVTGQSYMFEFLQDVPYFGFVSDVGFATLTEQFFNRWPVMLSDTSLSDVELEFLRSHNVLGLKESIIGVSSESLALAIGDALHKPNGMAWETLHATVNDNNRYGSLAAFIMTNWTSTETKEND